MAYKFIVKVKSIKTSIQTKVLVSGTLDGIILNTSIQETLANQEVFWDLDNVIANMKRPSSTLFRFKVESAETGQTMVEFEEDLDNFILKLNGLLKKSFEMSKMTDDNHEEMCIVTLQIYVAKLSDEKFKSPTQQKGDIFPIRKVQKQDQLTNSKLQFEMNSFIMTTFTLQLVNDKVKLRINSTP